MWAVLSGNLKQMECNRRDDITLTHLGNQKIVKLMCEKGAKPSPNSTELISAVMNGNSKMQI